MHFDPLPRRTTGVLTQVMSKVSSAVREIEAQRGPHADFWDAWNAEAMAADGPLWVALGDSTSQGIGADDPLEAWIPQVLDRVRETTGEPWRLVNLGVTGAQFGDIVEHQLPRLRALESSERPPSLVTHLAGANNLMAPATWPATIGHVREIVGALPDHSVIARVGVSSAFNSIMARRINSVLETAATARPLHLFWPWDWPARDGLAGDKFHPSTTGYRYMTDLIFPRVMDAIDSGLD